MAAAASVTAGDIIISELMCYATRKFQNVPRDSLKSILATFYTPSEVSAAKETFYRIADELAVDGLPRAVSRRKSDDRTRLETEDIVHLLEVLDERALINRLPKFVAHDPSRLPPYNTSDLDMCMLSLRVATLEERLASLASQCVASSSVADLKDPDVDSDSVGAQTNTGKWAELASDLQDGEFTVVSRRRSKPPKSSKAPGSQGPSTHVLHHMLQEQEQKSVATRRCMLRGTRGSDGATGVSAVPRRLTAFVGRLHTDTTEKDLCDVLSGLGIKEVKCKKLVAKDGRLFRTAAFMVSCSAQSRDLFYNESTWPEGAELRDWVFYDKKSD